MSENGAVFNEEGTARVNDLIEDVLGSLDTRRPVLLAGPTASGKSSLAMAIAAHMGGPVVNADALQVYGDWRVLTARPSPEDEAAIPHRLYGHVPGNRPYSVGQWLRDVAPFLDGPPPVIVGGTGLYFLALIEGLAAIPDIPALVRKEADERLATEGLSALLSGIDAETAKRIDAQNPMRVQRAWEVQRATGRGLAAWQDDTGPPLLSLDNVQAFVLSAPKDWLNPRIEARFDQMLRAGALDEARRNAANWRPDLPSAKAIGAGELIAHVREGLSLDAARVAAITLSRQYAKRQRSWFRGRMKDWNWINAG